jgi:hypothetical protein
MITNSMTVLVGIDLYSLCSWSFTPFEFYFSCASLAWWQDKISILLRCPHSVLHVLCHPHVTWMQHFHLQLISFFPSIKFMSPVFLSGPWFTHNWIDVQRNCIQLYWYSPSPRGRGAQVYKAMQCFASYLSTLGAGTNLPTDQMLNLVWSQTNLDHF